MDRCVRAFGLYRSGTTWLQATIDANIVSVPLPMEPNPGWYAYKHSQHDKQLQRIPDDYVIAVTYKTLLKWVDSLVRNSFDLIDEYDLSFRKGDTPIEIVYKEENHPEQEPLYVGVSLERLIDLYHAHWDFWHSQKTHKNVIILSHVKLASNPEAGICQIVKAFDLIAQPKFQIVNEVANSSVFNPSRCLDSDYTEFLTPLQRDVIAKHSRACIEEFLAND